MLNFINVRLSIPARLALIGALFIVPIVYSLLRKKVPVDFDRKLEEEEREDISVYLT